MEERINVAEILRNCQSGMELDCTMYNKVTLLNVDDGKNRIFPIKVLREDGKIMALTKYGQYTNEDFAKCVISPKGKTTWEGFNLPHEFKNGDIIFTRTFDSTWVSIFKQFSEDRCCTYIDLCIDDNDIYNTWGVCHIEEIIEQRLATEKEKLKLFDAISAYNYESNEETKTLEKLPKFKVGNWLQYRLAEPFFVEEITEQGYVNGNSCLPFEWENEIHLWTIQDAKDGDVLSNGKMIVIFKHFEEPSYRQRIVAHIGLDNNGGIQITDDTWCLGVDNVKPATKEQRDLLFQKMKESGYEWNSEKKELKKIEPKSTLSEEDEADLNNIIWLCNNCIKGSETTWIPSQATRIKHLIETIKEKGLAQQTSAWSEEDEKILEIITSVLQVNFKPTERFIGYEGYMNIDLINWLGALKYRYTWKPSDKQIEQLGLIAEQNKNNMIGKELMTLYNDLKKLKK